jgi:hypothetical protein
MTISKVVQKTWDRRTDLCLPDTASRARKGNREKGHRRRHTGCEMRSETRQNMRSTVHACSDWRDRVCPRTIRNGQLAGIHGESWM